MAVLIRGVDLEVSPAGKANDQIASTLRSAGATTVLAVRVNGEDAILAVGLVDHERFDLDAFGRDTEVVTVADVAPLVDRGSRAGDTVVDVGGVQIGGSGFTVIAGPCAVESSDMISRIAWAVRAEGASVLRGGAFKPRTSPYSFQGMGSDGLQILSEIRATTGLPVVSEVVDARDVEALVDHVDMLQVGARNAQNYSLLTELGRSDVPVLLKRGFGSTIDEWLGSAEYILVEGNENVVLCERGIRSFDPSLRFTLDLAAVALVKQRSHLPVVVDPSHATGAPNLIAPMTLAALAAGADGVIIDVHPDPATAKCDGAQAILPEQFRSLMAELRPVATAMRRWIAAPTLSTIA